MNSGEILTISNNSRMDVSVEIQVASLFLHAWSEVNHDLVYKPSTEPLESDELAILDTLNGLSLAAGVQLDSLKHKLRSRKILSTPCNPDISESILKSTKRKLIIIGQNLYGLLVENHNFEERLFKTLKEKQQLEVGIVVADPESTEAKEDLAYGYPTFMSNLAESIKVLKRYKQKARRCRLQDRFKIGTSKAIKRETLFISDLSEDMREGMISLRYTPMGARPEDRPEIVIESKKHPERCKELVEAYKGVLNRSCIKSL